MKIFKYRKTYFFVDKNNCQGNYSNKNKRIHKISQTNISFFAFYLFLSLSFFSLSIFLILYVFSISLSFSFSFFLLACGTFDLSAMNLTLYQCTYTELISRAVSNYLKYMKQFNTNLENINLTVLSRTQNFKLNCQNCKLLKQQVRLIITPLFFYSFSCLFVFTKPG